MDPIDGKLCRCPAAGIYRWKRKKPYHLVPREGVDLLKKVVLLILKSRCGWWQTISRWFQYRHMVLGITRHSNHFNVTYNVTFCFIKIMNEILMLLHEHVFKGFNFFFGPIIYCVRLRYENSLPLMVWEVCAMLLSPLSWPVLLSDAKGERRHVLTDLCCLPPTILLVPSLFMRGRGFRKSLALP